MTSDHWQRVKDLLVRALELSPEKRGAFLDQACGPNRAMRDEIDTLLSEEDAVRSEFLQSPPGLDFLGSRNDGGGEAADVPSAGQLFAERFQLVRKLGEGGMGQVWLAAQTSPVRRTVAVKLIRAGMYDESVVKRFQAERQSLAMMDHPAIAKVFDAGATPQGQPFFVMEYVPGLSITEYCDEKKLEIADRLELFIQACEGVQHAHQKAIIHRDLKPANILVVEIDGKPVPRIIDFGLAKATTPRLGGETFFTQMGHFVGTPGYMSPEQADPSEDIDTRTDVYSLGAVLYVLLAGSQPFETKAWEKLPLDELLRRLREEEPPSPSAKVGSDRNTSSVTAEARGTQPKQLLAMLRGDLDWITMKALEKDRSRRYATPSELASDIRRYLNHEAVSARPASTGYRLRKYVQRHEALVVGIATVLLVLVMGVAVSTFEAIHARQARQVALRERDLAERRFEDVHKMAREVIFNLQNQLAAIPGTTQVRRDLTAVAINYLDALARDATADISLQGELVGAYLRIGNIQGDTGTENLGDLPAALESYSKAERLARALVAKNPSRRAKGLLAEALMAQAYAAKYTNEPARAAAKAIEALALARKLAQSDPTSKDAQFALGAALQCAALQVGMKDRIFYLEEEASVFEGMLAHDPDNPDRWQNAALAHKYIAGHLIGSPDLDRAFVHLKRAEELDELALQAAPNNPECKMGVAIDLNQWGEYYGEKKDFAKAIQYTRASLAIRRELATADPKDNWAQEKLSYILSSLGDLQLQVSAIDALASYKQAKSIAEKLPTQSLRQERLASSISGIGNAYRKLGNVQRSCAAFAESLKLYRALKSPEHPNSAAATEKAYSRCPDANR
ncbi:MAG: protein kinase [Acidobacteriaceae bacterium]|nr:protein kinase [Acidobacteriaceae bacterium]MBV9780690.1 protein kinase [Acidobacteriaceae bacterium]